MKNRVTRTDSVVSRSRKPAEFRSVANRIMERASSGISRPELLKEVSAMLLEFSGCDDVKIVLLKFGRRYRCELDRNTNQPFRFEETPSPHDLGNEPVWATAQSDILEKVCVDIINRRVDTSLPCFTDNGSLWAGDTLDLPIGNLETMPSDGRLGISLGEMTKSFALMAIESGSDRIGILELESRTTDFFSEKHVELYESVAQTLGIAMAHRRLQEELRERVKELTCLYGIAKLGTQPYISTDEVLQNTVELLPPGWLYPDTCCARIVLDDHSYRTSKFRKLAQSQQTDIIIDGKRRGFVEVGYVWEKPKLDEGPFLNEERSLIDAVAREVAVLIEHRQSEEEKSRLHDQLRHADRLATIGQLGAGLAHELNEPLANILGFAQLINKDTSLPDQTKKDTEKIIGASLHAREVIGKLLTFARESISEKKLVNLNSLIEDGLYFLQSRCQKAGVKIVLDLFPDLPEIKTDRSQMLQVLTNLVVNSVQAMPDGGHVTITTSCCDNDVTLTVADTGIGMGEEVLKKVFDPFFTTKDVDQGTGLGLSVVHGIVTSNYGTIEVSSTVGQGAKFVIQLPYTKSNTSETK